MSNGGRLSNWAQSEIRRARAHLAGRVVAVLVIAGTSIATLIVLNEIREALEDLARSSERIEMQEHLECPAWNM